MTIVIERDMSVVANFSCRVNIAGREIVLPTDVHFDGYIMHVLCVVGIPCPETPLVAIGRGKSGISIIDRTGVIWREEIAPGEEGAFDFLKLALGIGLSPTDLDTLPVDLRPLISGSLYGLEITDPQIFLLRSLEQAQQVTNSFTGFRIDPLRNIDHNASHVVLVFSGKQVSSGFGINIENVVATETLVELTVQLTKLERDQKVQPLFTYPFAAIAIPRQDVPLQEGTSWRMFTHDGAFLAETTYP